MGLQTTGEVNENTVTGPYHPAIREMAETLMYKKKIEKYVLQNGKKDEITVFANSKDIAAVSGYKKENKRYFWEKYRLNIKTKTDNALKKGDIKIL